MFATTGRAQDTRASREVLSVAVSAEALMVLYDRQDLAWSLLRLSHLVPVEYVAMRLQQDAGCVVLLFRIAPRLQADHIERHLRPSRHPPVWPDTTQTLPRPATVSLAPWDPSSRHPINPPRNQGAAPLDPIECCIVRTLM